MFTLNFLNLLKNLKSKEKVDIKYISKLGRLGVLIAQEYSTRIDILDVDKCMYLSTINTKYLPKVEKHLLMLTPIKNPLYSFLEYYDNYPYSFSDMNYYFKASMKSGVEIEIKACAKNTRNSLIKNLNKAYKKVKYLSIFYPWIKNNFHINEILENIEKTVMARTNLANEIKYTSSLNDYIEKYKKILDLENIKFPRPYNYLSTTDMIVREYIYGNYFYDALEQKLLTYQHSLAVIKTQLFFILKIGVFHNNLHSGNLILSDNKEIYFQDCNFLSSITGTTKQQFLRLLKAIILKNYPYVSVILNELSENSVDSIKLDELSTKIKDIFTTYKNENTEIFFIKVIRAFKEGINIGMEFSPDVFSVFKNFFYFDSLLSKTKVKNSKIKTDILDILNHIEETINESTLLT